VDTIAAILEDAIDDALGTARARWWTLAVVAAAAAVAGGVWLHDVRASRREVSGAPHDATVVDDGDGHDGGRVAVDGDGPRLVVDAR
jgi:hypothetical protein